MSIRPSLNMTAATEAAVAAALAMAAVKTEMGGESFAKGTEDGE